MSFYNYTKEQALNMKFNDYKKLVISMRQLKAREWLQIFELNCVPKMEQKDREKVRKRLYKQAYPENFKKENVARNLNDLVAKLRGGLSGK
jgi:hypothetical protein